LKDAKERCPELVVVHVATYKEGEKEPGYWDNVDTRTHKVRMGPSAVVESVDHIRRTFMSATLHDVEYAIHLLRLKVSLDYYRRESMKIITMFKEGLPGVEVGKPYFCS
jgi:DNA polymerase eta